MGRPRDEMERDRVCFAVLILKDKDTFPFHTLLLEVSCRERSSDGF